MSKLKVGDKVKIKILSKEEFNNHFIMSTLSYKTYLKIIKNILGQYGEKHIVSKVLDTAIKLDKVSIYQFNTLELEKIYDFDKKIKFVKELL